MEILKVHVNRDDDTALLECPQCGTAKSGYVGKFKGAKRTAKVRCRCQAGFHVSFEFRQAPRKETNIQGFYAKRADAHDWKKMLVTNISVAGIGLLTYTMHSLSKGDQLRVRFNLNGVRQSIVEKDAVVRWVADGNIGCEFTEAVGHENTYEAASLSHFLTP